MELNISEKTMGLLRKMRERMLVTPEICTARGYYMTQSYMETEGQPEAIRRARALYKIFTSMEIGISDDELIVGRTSTKVRGAALSPELRCDWYLDELELLSTRDIDRFAPMSREEKDLIREFVPYWRGKSIRDKWEARVPEEYKMIENLSVGGATFCSNNQYYGHTSADYALVINKGTNAIIAEIDQRLAALDLGDLRDFEKSVNLRASKIALQALNAYARRYSLLAAQMAKTEPDPQRQRELLAVSEACAQVPARPARSFHEGVQSAWFACVALVMEGWGTGLGMLRTDQYLWPLYEKDKAAGIMDADKACLLIGMLYIKANEPVIPYKAEQALAYAGFAVANCITLGGVKADGSDAVNELSYIMLEAEKHVALNEEDIIVRVGRDTPDDFLLAACDTVKAVGGKLKFVGEETVTKQFLIDGRSLEMARDFAVVGCTSPTIPGKSLDIPGGVNSLPMMLELALNNGVSRMTGKQLGVQTGDAALFERYDQLWDALRQQMEHLLPKARMMANVAHQLYGEFMPNPFQSALCPICIQRGVDVIQGGTYPNISFSLSLAGAPNAGDSLSAIKKLVFEDKKLTMADVLRAIDKNFEGEERVLALLNSAPKFGNNNPYVDSIVNDLLSLGSHIISKGKCYAGAIPNTAAAAITANIGLGMVVGALPDGRRAGEPLSEGGISPHQGRNVSGPTATMMSIAGLDHMKLRHGSVLNMRFDPSVLEGEEKKIKFANLIRTYFDAGGFLVQFNVVSTETLRHALTHPEEHKDLIVRVATYAAYFVELTKELQEDIINRIEFGSF